MIVQCGQCNTKFRLDDAKVKDNGVKVRCSKCRHVFTVFREPPQEDDSDFDVMLNSLSSAAGETALQQDPVAGSLPPEILAAPATAASEERPVAEFGPAEDSVRIDGFDFTDQGGQSESPLQEDTPTLDEGFGAAFDFSEPAAGEPAPVPEPEPAGFGTANVGMEPAAEGGEFAAEFDFRDAPEEPGQPDATTTGAPFGDAQEDDPFFLKLGDADDKSDAGDGSFFPLTDENPTAVAPEAFAAAGVAEEQKEEGVFELRSESTPEPTMPAAPDDLPPLPISSRRRNTTTLPVIVTAISIVFVIILAGAGFYFLSEGPQGLKKMGLGGLAEWAGLEQPDEGKMGIRATAGSFVVNKEAGELFVVTGEVVNGYRKSRASVQVRGLVYGPKGEVLVRRTAYCGNQMTKEQLGTMPLSKIEAVMNNQFGDSLSNLGVPSGKGIPFVLVFSQLPKNASEYGVEVAGSTVASQ